MPIRKTEMVWNHSLDLSGIPLGQREEAKADVISFLKEQYLSTVSGGTSPVTGKGFAPLSPDYADYKATISGDPTANMELHGNLLDALDVWDKGGSKIALGWTDPEEAAKAHGHTTGAKGRLPVRPLIPEPGQTLDGDIMDGIESILNRYRADD